MRPGLSGGRGAGCANVEPMATVRGRGGGEGVRTRDHLANARTLLAFLRTALTLAAAALVVRHVDAARNLPTTAATAAVGAAWLILATAAARFALQRRAIERAKPRTFVPWDIALVVMAALAGAILLVSVSAT